jgi:nucleotidyltransferase substrate binding protein (TIGR01987 family)
MTKQWLDLSSLVNAINSLGVAVDAYQQKPADLFIRDASIQRFEYTYELCHKMLKRYLEKTEPNAESIDQMSFPDLIRTGSERGLLLSGWDSWNTYRYARNLTSHTYNEAKAIQVCQVIPTFLTEAQHLLSVLQERIASS